MLKNKLFEVATAAALALSAVGITANVNSNHQTVQASSRLKRAYIPKRFRGTWYANKHDKIKITANSVGGNVIGKTYSKFYYGGYKNIDGGVSKNNFVRYQGKTMIILFEKGGSDTLFRIVNRHHRKTLDFERSLGHIYFYRSQAAAKHYGNY